MVQYGTLSAVEVDRFCDACSALDFGAPISSVDCKMVPWGQRVEKLMECRGSPFWRLAAYLDQKRSRSIDKISIKLGSSLRSGASGEFDCWLLFLYRMIAQQSPEPIWLRKEGIM